MRKTSKILAVVFVFILGVITFLSVTATASLNFKKFTVKEDPINVDGIKYLYVDGNIILYLNSSENGQGIFPPQLNGYLGMLQKGDTLLVYSRKNSSSHTIGMLNRCDDLIYINAKNNCNIIANSLSKENNIVEVDNSNVRITGRKMKKGLKILGKGRSSISIENYPDTLTVNLMDYSQLTSFGQLGVIRGEIKNKSYIEAPSIRLDTKNFVKKDSAAVIFR